MKTWSILFLCFILFSSCGTEGDYLDDIKNPNVLRSASIDASSLHLAFPSIAGNKDRSRILITYREGLDHISFDGKIIQMESFDKGKSWLNRKVIYRPVENGDARDPQMLVLPDENVICRFFERTSEANSKVKCITSSDFGQTYSNMVEFPFPTKDETFAATRGNMVIVDGVIYSISYNRWALSWLVKSEDEGKTWKTVSWVDKTLGTQASNFNRINECSLGFMNGKMYIVARTQKDDAFLQVGVSEDLGATWTWDFLPVKGQAPSLTPYKNSFILTYRLVDKVAEKYSFEIALLKDGKLASTPVALFNSSSFDVGYGDVLTLSNSFLVCCYQPNKIRCFEIKYSVFD